MASDIGDEMEDSLFEGMVLFTPDSQFPALAPVPEHSDPPPPPPPNEADVEIGAPTMASEPLDENLFSDLTLVSPLQSSDPPSPATAASSVTRQISRKKKRATLRVGYGRISPSSSFSVQSTAPDRASNTPADEPFDYDDDDRERDRDDLRKNGEEEEQRDHEIAATHSPDFQRNGEEVEQRDRENAATHSIDLQKNSEEEEQRDHESDATHSTDIQEKGKEDEQRDQESAATHSIEDNFERIKAEIAQKLNLALELAASVSGARKESISRRRKAADSVNLASIKHRELELELEKACDAEDFEMAERVSDSLAAAESEKQAMLDALIDAEAECDAIDSQMHEVLNSQIAAEEECVSLLEHFSSDAANNADLVLKKAEILSSKEMDKWLSSTEALEVKKMELEIESDLVSEARMVFNDSIEHSIEDDKREKEFFCKKKDVLTDELVKLLALVKEKEKEIAENDANIEAVEKRITAVVSGFQETQSSINEKYNNLQSGLSQMDLEREALSVKRQEIEEFLAHEEDRGLKLRELARVSADEAKAYQEVVGLRKILMSSILKSREDKVRLAKTEKKLSEDVQKLQQEVSIGRATLQELSSSKSSIQQNIASFRQRVFFIDKRVPELEAEKKVAAAARNFKEAARIAAEAKSLNVEKEGIQIDMEKAILELGKVEEEIKDTVNQLQDTEGVILSKEKEVAMARFQRLLLIAGAATAERSAALELGDLEEANLLLVEAEAADSEAKKLQPIYNFKEEEFADLPKHFISMELVSNLGGKPLAELAASVHLSAA